MSNATCSLVNTYEILEYVMGIDGLHPHSLKTVENSLNILAASLENKNGVIIDVGCGSGQGTKKLSQMVPEGILVVGIDINEHAIKKAKTEHGTCTNLNFYHGDLKEFKKNNPEIKVHGIIAVSVSMFIPQVQEFYRDAFNILEDDGIFIDLPFVFKEAAKDRHSDFTKKTYAVCGCNMKMYTIPELRNFLLSANFSDMKSKQFDFELMNLRALFQDYPLKYLLSNFLKNTWSPKGILKNVSSWYLFWRTLGIFGFFLKNKKRYGAGELIAIKRSSDR